MLGKAIGASKATAAFISRWAREDREREIDLAEHLLANRASKSKG
jgi:hypothetical protein